jgi:predicted amidophosphoribosyltransferase
MTTLVEPELEQKRFFCENCERELFLNASYCDNCGGKIEWPEKYISAFSEKKKHGKKNSHKEE